MIIATNALYSVTIISIQGTIVQTRIECWITIFCPLSCIFLGKNKIIDKAKGVNVKQNNCPHGFLVHTNSSSSPIFCKYYSDFQISTYVCCFKMKLKIFSSFALNSNKYINRWWWWCRYFSISLGWNWIHPHFCALWTHQPGLD